MFCKQCGVQLDDGAKFCHQCGASTESVNETPVQQPPQPQYSQPSYQYNQPNYQPQQSGYVNNNNAYSQSTPGNGTGIPAMILGILALVLMPFACFGAYGVMGLLIFVGVPFLFSIVGLVLGIISNHSAKRVGRRNGMGVAGIVCSSISLGLYAVLIVLVILAAAGIFYYGW